MLDDGISIECVANSHNIKPFALDAGTYRFAVTGGRRFADAALVRYALERLSPSATLVHGAARGLDSLAAMIWDDLGRECDPHPADWNGPCHLSCRPGHRSQGWGNRDYCPMAGNYRNQEMALSGIEFLFAFEGGFGTRNMMIETQLAGVPVYEVRRSILETPPL